MIPGLLAVALAIYLGLRRVADSITAAFSMLEGQDDHG